MSSRSFCLASVAFIVVAGAMQGCGLGRTNDLGAGSAPGLPGDTNGDQGGDGPAGNGNQPGQSNAVRLSGSFGAAAVASSKTKLYVSCHTLTQPPRVARAQLDDAGNFAVSLAGGKNNYVSCALLGGDDTLLANLTFKGGGSDLFANTAAAHAVNLRADAQLGRIYYDETTFEAAADASALGASRSPASAPVTAAQLAGSYVVAPIDFAPPAASQGPCAADAVSCPSGLRSGSRWTLAVHSGSRLSDGSAALALQAWDNATQAAACGNGVGVPTASLANSGLDFGVANGPLAYSTTLGYADALAGGAAANSQVTAGYQLTDTAHAATGLPRCQPALLMPNADDGVQGSACGPDAGGTYRLGGSAGCVDAASGRSSAAVPAASDWAQAVAAGTCSTTPASNGLTAQDCTVTVAATGQQLRCRSYVGDFADAAATLAAVQPFDATSFAANPAAASGTRCAAMDVSTPAGALMQRRCYADYMLLSAADEAPGACLAQYRLNEAFTDPAVQLTVQARPKHLRHAELLDWSESVHAGTATTREVAMLPAWSAHPQLGLTPLSCKVVTARSISLLATNGGRLLVAMTTQSGTDDLRPACLATYAVGATRTLAYLNKY